MTVNQQDDAVRQNQRFFDVMRYEQYGVAFALPDRRRFPSYARYDYGASSAHIFSSIFRVTQHTANSP